MFPNNMKTYIIVTLLALYGLQVLADEKVVLPEKYITEQFKWAEEGETPQIRADRLEAFWNAHLPRENGGENPEAPNGYEDGTHSCIIIVCAWQLTRAYVETGQKEKALKIIDWLAKNDSRTALAPIKTEDIQQTGTSNGG